MTVYLQTHMCLLYLNNSVFASVSLFIQMPVFFAGPVSFIQMTVYLQGHVSFLSK